MLQMHKQHAAQGQSIFAAPPAAEQHQPGAQPEAQGAALQLHGGQSPQAAQVAALYAGDYGATPQGQAPEGDDEPTIAAKDFSRLAALRERREAAGRTIGDKSGVSPLTPTRDNSRFLNGRAQNGAITQMRAALPEIAAFMNQRLAEKKCKQRVTEIELLSNFLVEGGNKVLDGDATQGISGYGAAGIDTLVSRFKQWEAFLPEALKAEIVAGLKGPEQMGPRFESHMDDARTPAPIVTMNKLKLVEVLWASAAMYTAYACDLERDLRQSGQSTELPKEAQVFWRRLYFNTNQSQGHDGYGKEMLSRNKAGWYQQAWAKDDSYGANNRTSQYNALVGMAAFQLLSAEERAMADVGAGGGDKGEKKDAAPGDKGALPEPLEQRQWKLPELLARDRQERQAWYPAACRGEDPLTERLCDFFELHESIRQMLESSPEALPREEQAALQGVRERLQLLFDYRKLVKNNMVYFAQPTKDLAALRRILTAQGQVMGPAPDYRTASPADIRRFLSEAIPLMDAAPLKKGYLTSNGKAQAEATGGGDSFSLDSWRSIIDTILKRHDQTFTP